MLSVLSRQRLLLPVALVLAQVVSFCLASVTKAEDMQGQGRRISAPTSASDTYFSQINLENVSVVHQGKNLGEISVYHPLEETLIPRTTRPRKGKDLTVVPLTARESFS